MVTASLLFVWLAFVMARPRLLPHRSFPSYAYLPGRHPHPVRDPEGHSYQTEHRSLLTGQPPDPEAFAWGQDLFNHGYYWEAHEAWESLWHQAESGSALHTLLKGLILLAAAGVKMRERKHDATQRHARRAATLFRRLAIEPDQTFARAIGMAPAELADHVEKAVMKPLDLTSTAPGSPEPVFDFVLVRGS